MVVKMWILGITINHNLIFVEHYLSYINHDLLIMNHYRYTQNFIMSSTEQQSEYKLFGINVRIQLRVHKNIFFFSK